VQKSKVALGELELVRSARAHASDLIAPRMQGVLQTSWGSFTDLVNAYYGASGAGSKGSRSGYLQSTVQRDQEGPMKPAAQEGGATV